eukprot:CAMPEP_0171926778 /NCGR_PEP_ID=MMETSP0993-20121228/25174_1 /TAXON_ID=483369 /ORGANISM="non described non described, Strain CCMP2098" /LENGTH=172 /DNA_ID=CAMNT_0012565665 /DNA_START=102 /DNA_END=616 /DNA_ORIENTATION=+
MINEKESTKAASADAKGISGHCLNASLAKASMIRSMHCASPGSRNSSKNTRKLWSKVSPRKSKSSAYEASTAAWRGYLSAGPFPMNSPTCVLSIPGVSFSKRATATARAGDDDEDDVDDVDDDADKEERGKGSPPLTLPSPWSVAGGGDGVEGGEGSSPSSCANGMNFLRLS